MRFFITAIFLVLAAWFALVPGAQVVPDYDSVVIDAADINRGAGRKMMLDPPTTRIGTLDQTCQACHGIFASSQDEAADRQQHGEIVLEHGMNNRCDNCHSRENRDMLILYGGREVGFSEVELLCAKCHGLTYRDWQRGVHGKTRGSWNPASPEYRLMRCTECHDAHRPAFQHIEPLPAPTTLRMRATERNVNSHTSTKRNPLLDFETNHGDSEDAHGEGDH